ncbi:MAG TPA: ABC transporter ATP-binding protein [Acidimicrobiia bacterium]|jgi:putative spermidine/putrescine transport system ATP-binding protein
MAFLSLQRIRKEFGGHPAVEDFNLDVEAGEFVSFLGPSGCGKTTTLRMIAGFERPSSGVITINGKDITNARPNDRNVGMVFQSYALFPNMTVAQNVGFGLKLKKAERADIKSRVDELLDLIHMPDKGGNYPHELSGGQQQRVALARALAIRPQVLLLDEPLSALDAKIRDELRNEIKRIQRQLGITTIYVTHDQEEAMALSDRVVVMSRGIMEQVGPPFQIYNFPETAFVASFVGKLNRLNGQVLNPDTGSVQVGPSVLRTTSEFTAQSGDAVTLMVRPEELELGEGEENQVSGLVESINFLGAIVRVRLDTATGPVTADLFNERLLKLPAVGDTVTLSFPAHACWVMRTGA